MKLGKKKSLVLHSVLRLLVILQFSYLKKERHSSASAKNQFSRNPQNRKHPQTGCAAKVIGTDGRDNVDPARKRNTAIKSMT